MYDALVIGGGPAGLTAALYLARFRLTVLLADDGSSRALLIPKTHNQPFWPNGISGHDLLRRMREQLSQYPVDMTPAAVESVSRSGPILSATIGDERVSARGLVLATGVFNRRPRMSEQDHAEALRRGLLRYCPICDAYEVIDQNIAIVGHGDRLVGEAKFLRSYSAEVSVFAEGRSLGLSRQQRTELEDMGIKIIDASPLAYLIRNHALEVAFEDEVRSFDSLYAALGSEARSGLAASLGARVTEDGCLIVDDHQRTSVPGLYAAGDVVAGVDQIGHAIGQATVAATALRNDMCPDMSS